MRRKKGWESRLAAYIRKVADKPFEWGKLDCCLFATECVYEITGEDYAEEFRQRYSDEMSAKKALLAIGKGTLLETAERIAQKHGYQEVDIPFVQRGDLAYIVVDRIPALGIIDMTARQALSFGPNGLIAVPLDKVQKVWRIE